MAKAKKQQFHLVVLGFAAVAVFLAVILGATGAAAKPEQMVANKEVNKQGCDSQGSPVINITQRVLNSVDSGEAGNYWAYDTYNRHIQVWKENDNEYCVLADYEGQFDAQKDQKSPGNTGILTGKEDGTFKGGYRATIMGTMKTTPELPTKGSIGTVDYRCDLSANCPGAFNWIDKYFTTGAMKYSFSYDWWGWTYNSKGHSWTNAIDGNSGDVL